MISKISAVVGTNLASLFTEQGIKLVPKNNTLLSELVTSNNTNNGIGYSNLAMNNDEIASSIEYTSTGEVTVHNNKKEYVSSSHDNYIDNYTIDLTKIVTGYISFSRNVVNKEVTLLSDMIKEALTNYSFKEPEDYFKVTWYKLPTLFSGIVASEIIRDEYTGKYFKDSINLDVLNTEEFKLDTYLLIGDSDEDKEITSWIAGIGIDKVKGYIYGDVNEYDLAIKDLLEYSFVNYLFYRNLVERKDLNVGLNSLSINTKGVGCRDYYASKFKIAYELYQRDIRVGKLIGSNNDIGFSFYNETEKEVTIFQDSFDKLAEGGGGIEMLFGYMCSVESSNDITVDKLLSNSDKWLNVWKNTRSLYVIYMNNSRLDIFKRVAKEVYYSQCKAEISRDQDENEYIISHVGFLEETIKLGNEYIDSIHSDDLDKLDTICLELVARIRFRYTNAYEILKDMVSVLESNKDISVNEAALYSVIAYLTEYMAQQMDVVRV